ncbi:MAG: thioredoxin family protein [Bacteroidales bacterium]|nr:thioredoxin family protein [Bacteroidales bacterium]
MSRLSASVILILLGLSFSFSQENQVKWTKSSKSLGNGEYELTFAGIPNEHWHMYGVNDKGKAFEIVFDDEKLVKVIGKISQSPQPKKYFDDLMGFDREEFAGAATFKVKVKYSGKEDKKITGYIDYQTCVDEEHGGICQFEKEDFSFEFSSPKIEINEIKHEENSEIVVEDSSQNIAVLIDSTEEDSAELTVSQAELDEDIEIETDTDISKESLWMIFWIAFGAGLIAIVTPCVLPMIPMTVSFFMKGSENKAKGRRQAVLFGIFIIIIFVILGTAVAFAFGEQFSNWLSTHWLPNILFFLIFMFFAAAFFGMFELTMPAWLINKSDKHADKGGFMGVFFMAFTLVLVSFSCTAPIVGSILVFSAQGEFLIPIVGMAGFGLAFALPFTLFALFPRWLNNMPKSGGWLNSVKVVLGFVELALALKFLSMPDLTYHWGLLNRDIYLALWIAIFSLMGIYLIGKIKFKHDDDLKYIPVPRLILAIFTFGFVIYMIPGMFGAPLKLLAGWIPPEKTHSFDLRSIMRETVKNSGKGDIMYDGLCEKPKYDEHLEIPHGLQGYFDLNQALECSKNTNKPIFVDFTGLACNNCRLMEENVWNREGILEMLRDEYIIVSLYVDDRTKLDEADWTPADVSKDGRVKKTIGDKYSDYQARVYGENSQPKYYILDHTGKKVIDESVGYSTEENFRNFLKKGIKVYKKKNKAKAEEKKE